MRNKLLFVVLALAILISLTAGSLAVYAKTVTDTRQVSAKRFVFSAVGDIAGDDTVIRLAPTESMEYDFTISNVDDLTGLAAEVPLQYDITINYALAASMLPGLAATLYSGGETVGVYENGYITYTAQSPAGVLFENSYRVVLTWVDDGSSDAQQTAAGSRKVSLNTGLALTVEATQTF
jgi:hypothetical protein